MLVLIPFQTSRQPLESWFSTGWCFNVSRLCCGPVLDSKLSSCQTSRWRLVAWPSFSTDLRRCRFSSWNIIRDGVLTIFLDNIPRLKKKIRPLSPLNWIYDLQDVGNNTKLCLNLLFRQKPSFRKHLKIVGMYFLYFQSSLLVFQ